MKPPRTVVSRRTAAKRPSSGGASSGSGRAAETDLRRPRGWRLWGARLSLAIGGPLLVVGLAEALLRLAGYGYPTAFLLREKDAPVYIENSKFLWQFYSRKTNLRPNPLRVTVGKPADALRIVILGESAAAGTPEPAFNFGRILERMLRHRHPQNQIEVINAAMPGVNSHILLRVAQDCARLRPDLFVLYMANNEAVGLYAPGPRSGGLTPHLRLLRALQWLRTTKLGQLAEPLLPGVQSEGTPGEAQDETFFLEHRVAADDPRRAAVYANFRANLAGICSAARQASASVVMVTVPVNLRDCPPFGSLHRSGISATQQERWQAEYEAGAQAEANGNYADALARFRAAAAFDDHFADLHFRMAHCYETSGLFEQAREEFVRARDWDALQFRADSRMNRTIRETANRLAGAGVQVVDAERAFADAEPGEHHCPGNRLFHDNVHLNFEGDYFLAKTLLPEVTRSLLARLGPATNAVLSREECAASLAYTRVNAAQIEAQVVQTTALPPFTAQLGHATRQKGAEQQLAALSGALGWTDYDAGAEAYRTAIRQAPEDWQLPFLFARLLMLKPDFPGAIAQFNAAKRLMPHSVAIRIGLAAALNRAGRPADAQRELEQARTLDPDSQAVQAAIAALSRTGR